MRKSYVFIGGIILLLASAIFFGGIETETVRYESTGELYAYEVCINHGKYSDCFHVPRGIITALSAVGVRHHTVEIVEENANPFGILE
ncbi:MAG: hypothetical protein G01um10148_737 [Parcubacteria group bacterium Gr01-1014_8]|nr:MAG: hypothetical protein G01um10148_737 [Parcubacteria group bacterium Gr01-1014_8]